MIDRIINCKNLKEADTIILSASYEGGISFMGGAALAPKKIISCLDNNLELYDPKLLCEPAKILKTAHFEIKGLKNLSSEKMVEKIKKESQPILENNKFPILLGGEHGVSLGVLEAIANENNPKNITILQIDAHQDLRNDNSDYEKHPSKYAHSCVMRRAHELGYNLVQVGIRTFSKYEWEYSLENKNTIEVFSWQKDTPEPKIEEILKAIKTEKVYLSIDVDGFDPSVIPGTGTPVPGGLGWNYGLNLIEKLFRKKEIIGADIVEVAPQKDSVLSEFAAAYLVYFIMTQKFEKKLKS